MIDDKLATNNAPIMERNEWTQEIKRGILTGKHVQVVSDFDYDPKCHGVDSEEVGNLPELDASLLREILVNAGDQYDPKGLTIDGARIVGELDLQDISLGFPITLVRVIMEDGINLRGIKSPKLIMYRCLAKSISMEHAEIGNLVMIKECLINEVLDVSCISCGEMRLHGNTILAHALKCDTSVEHGAEGESSKEYVAAMSDIIAFDATAANVRGMVQLHDLEAYGEIQFVGAKIGAYLSLAGSRLRKNCLSHSASSDNTPSSCAGSSVCMDSVEIGGILNLSNLHTEDRRASCRERVF